jgi:hypothetical protein
VGGKFLTSFGIAHVVRSRDGWQEEALTPQHPSLPFPLPLHPNQWMQSILVVREYSAVHTDEGNPSGTLCQHWLVHTVEGQSQWCYLPTLGQSPHPGLPYLSVWCGRIDIGFTLHFTHFQLKYIILIFTVLLLK